MDMTDISGSVVYGQEHFLGIFYQCDKLNASVGLPYH